MARCVDCLHHEPCAAFDLIRTKLWGDNADKMCRMFQKAVPDINVGDKPPCKVCERITEANKDIFWVFARTHQPGTREEFLQIPAEDVRFCPVCGRKIEKLREITLEEYTRSVKGEWERKENRS